MKVREPTLESGPKFFLMILIEFLLKDFSLEKDKTSNYF